MNFRKPETIIFRVKGELGREHHIPADLSALKKPFFDEVFLIRKIIEYHCKKMDSIDIVQQRAPLIFPIGIFFCFKSKAGHREATEVAQNTYY